VPSPPLAHDFVEVTWSGFTYNFHTVPDSLIHMLALISFHLHLIMTWVKGYSDINVLGHSWGTALSYDLLDETPLPINHWVTMGSPLTRTTPKPTSVQGNWIDVYSNDDTVTLLEVHPPFPPFAVLASRANWARVNWASDGSALVFDPDVNLLHNATGMTAAVNWLLVHHLFCKSTGVSARGTSAASSPRTHTGRAA
jgi:pimeloyl-ACP methyl ester carboxylesterase